MHVSGQLNAPNLIYFLSIMQINYTLKKTKV